MVGQAQRRGGSRWTLAVWGGAGALLLIPAVAMRFTTEVAWTAFDFAFAAAVLGLVALGVELAVRNSLSAAYRMGAALALVAGAALVVIIGAVGIVGSEQENANLLYAAVLVTAAAGAVVARFRAAGLARTMVAAAAVQVAVPGFAAATGAAELVSRPEVLGATAAFAALWLAAAWQFGRAAR
jgi:hypothetical protein